MLCSPGVNTLGTEKFLQEGGKEMSFLLSFNRSKVRNSTLGKSGVIKLGGDYRHRDGALELQDNSLEKPRQGDKIEGKGQE